MGTEVGLGWQGQGGGGALAGRLRAKGLPEGWDSCGTSPGSESLSATCLMTPLRAGWPSTGHGVVMKHLRSLYCERAGFKPFTVISSLIPHDDLWILFYPHSSDEESDILGDEVPCSGSQHPCMVGLGLA